MRSLTDIFYVRDNDGGTGKENLVPAKFLIGLDGLPVVNPNSTPNTVNSKDNHYFNADGTTIFDANSHNYLVVPANYSISMATTFAYGLTRLDEQGLSPSAFMAMAFIPGGSEDLQKTYKNVDGSMTFAGVQVPMFQDAASFHLGIVAQLTGYGSVLAEIGGSLVDIPSQSYLIGKHYIEEFVNFFGVAEIDAALTVPQAFKNNERNMRSIAAGAAYIQSHIHEIANLLPPMEPVNNEQSTTDQNMERPFHESRLLESAHQTGRLHTDAGVGGLAVDVDNEVNNAVLAINPIINNETLADDGTPSYDINVYDVNGYDSNGDDNTGSNGDASDN